MQAPDPQWHSGIERYTVTGRGAIIVFYCDHRVGSSLLRDVSPHDLISACRPPTRRLVGAFASSPLGRNCIFSPYLLVVLLAGSRDDMTVDFFKI